MDEQAPVLVTVEVLEFGGEGYWGVRDFRHLPRRGDIIELLDDDFVGKVEEVRYLDVEADGSGGDIALYVTRVT